MCFTNGGIHTRSIISQLLLCRRVLKFVTKIKLRHRPFHSMVKYATYLICIICIFMNINKNAKK